jgi:hypothetical protein
VSEEDLELVFQAERHRRQVAEQRANLLEARHREVVSYLKRLTYSPLRDKLLGMLRDG